MANSLYKNNVCILEESYGTKVMHEKHAEFSILNLAIYTHTHTSH